MKELYDKITNKCSLTTAEKQEIFDDCHKGIYKLAGWQFDFRSFMKRYVIKTYDTWTEIYAFTKSNIRNNIFTKTGLREIHEINKL